MKIWLDRKQRKSITNLTGKPFKKKRVTVYVGKKGARKTGFALFDLIVNPAHHPIKIHYMVLFQPQGSIRNVEILEYQGLQRDEVVSESFLSQFKGNDIHWDFQSVKSIQGLTVPILALTQGLFKLTAIIHTHINPR